MNGLFAVIVTYNPEVENVYKLLSLLKDNKVASIVVDNSNLSLNLDFSGIPFIFERLGGNKGIAAAQNVGIKKALEAGASRIVFFDQDTQLSSSFIEEILRSFDDSKVKIAAPVFYDNVKGFGYKLVDINKAGFRKKIKPESLVNSIDVSVAISSGTVVDAKVFEEVGLMDESLFIDYVDTEWCLRCFSHGLKVRINPKAVMYHSIGDNSLEVLGLHVPVHSPTRRYYRVRNAILLFRIAHIPKLLCVREIVFAVIHQMVIVASQKDRASYLRYFFKGLIDGLRNKAGAMR